MDKMLRIKSCAECPWYACGPLPGPSFCWREHRDVEKNDAVADWCPLDAAAAPYSAENPPRVGDVVQVDHYAMPGQVHAIEEGMIQVKGPRANGWWPLTMVALVYRPQGDTP